MASGQTFESDLRAVREAHGLSLSEIHQQTRIPVDVLRRFEDGALLADPTFNEVYLKALMQSYAKAVGVPPSVVMVAYDDQRAGAYRGALHPNAPAEPPAPKAEAPKAEVPKAEAPKAETPKAESREASPPEAAAPKAAAPSPAPTPSVPTAAKPSPTPLSDAPPAVAALRETPDPEKARAAAPPPKTLAEARVNRPAVPTANRSFDKNWTTILGLFVVVLVLIAAALYFLVFSGDDVPDPDPEVAEAVTGEAPGPTERAPAETRGPELQLPMRAVLTAGGDGLQSFRVTVDDEGRRPYWIEVGQSETFEADSLLILWGEDPSSDFSEATVEIQGLRFTPANGRELVLTPQTGQRLLDSLATAPSTPTP